MIVRNKKIGEVCMNKIKIIIPLLSWLFLPMMWGNSAVNYQEIFLQANEHYKKQEYQQAYDLYSRIEYKNPQTHYNLGNCAFKLGRLGRALLHWRRAEQDCGIFDREELLTNINLVKKKLGLLESKEKKGATDNPFMHLIRFCKKTTSSFSSFVRSAPLLLLQIMFLLLWGFLLLYVRYLYRRHHKIILVLLFACVAMSGAMLATKYGNLYRQYGVVVAEGRLYSGPGENYQFLGTAQEGQEGEIKRMVDDYYKVKIGSIMGWLHQKHFEKI